MRRLTELKNKKNLKIEGRLEPQKAVSVCGFDKNVSLHGKGNTQKFVAKYAVSIPPHVGWGYANYHHLRFDSGNQNY